MKIINLLSSDSRDLAADTTLSLCRSLHAAGHTVAVMCRPVEDIVGPLKDAGVETVTASLRGALDVISPVRLSKMLRQSQEERIVIHVHRFADAATAARARLLAKMPQVKIVLSRHLEGPAKTGVTASSAYAEIDAMLFHGETSRELFMSTAPEISPSRLHIVPPVVDLSTRSEVTGVKDPDMFTLLVAGPITADKGLVTLMEALGEVRRLPWRLVVTGQGQGPQVMPAIRAARRLGISDRIEWLGDDAKMDRAANEADLAVAPEHAVRLHDRSLPCYLAAGLPVVATDIPSHVDRLAGRKATRLVPVADSHALAEALARMIPLSRLERPEPEMSVDYARRIVSLYTSLF